MLVLLFAALLSQGARADLFTAQLTYQKADYQAAAKDYRQLAVLGNPIAQYDLATLYLNGQGVKHTNVLPCTARSEASLGYSNSG
jgi:TPR repeat protein